MRSLKGWAKAHWPALTLRTILFGTLLFVAALPGIGAVFLRVYENTLVQQTEAELIAQGAVLAAAYKQRWNEGHPSRSPGSRLQREQPQIDLRTNKILPPLADAAQATGADPRALRAARGLQPIVAEAQLVTLAAIRLLDGRGVVILGRDDLARSYAAAEEVRSALGGKPATVLRKRGGYEPRYMLEAFSRASSIRVHHVRPVTEGARVIGLVMLSRSPRGLFLGIYQDRGKILLGVLGILATLIVLAGILSRGISRPLEDLGAASERVALGFTELPETPPMAAVEIQALYENFRAMAAKIEQRSRYLRDFAAAVSHEFKTPIAGIKGAVELLDEHGEGMSGEQRHRFLLNAAADADRLSRLVERLLDLARADMTRMDELARTDVAASVQRTADPFRSADFRIDYRQEGMLRAARVAEEVFDTIFEILFDNSRRAGAHKIDVSAGQSGGLMRITVSDDGCGIASADAEKVFEPFFTGRRSSGGTGLGLPIAASLLSASGGTIELLAADQGAAFLLRIPLAGR